MSLRERIFLYCKRQPDVWISGDEIEKKSQSKGYKASTGSRRARELAEDGDLERKEVKGTVFYSYVPKKRKIEHIEVIDGRAIRSFKTVSV